MSYRKFLLDTSLGIVEFFFFIFHIIFISSKYILAGFILRVLIWVNKQVLFLWVPKFTCVNEKQYLSNCAVSKGIGLQVSDLRSFWQKCWNFIPWFSLIFQWCDCRSTWASISWRRCIVSYRILKSIEIKKVFCS